MNFKSAEGWGIKRIQPGGCMVRKIMFSWLIMLIILSTADTVCGFEQNNIQIHGFASQGYLISTENSYLGNSEDGSYEYNEVGINFSALINDDLRFGLQLFSRDLGPHGNNDLNVDWAFLDYNLRDWLGFRAGKIKMPFGLYNRKRDADMLRTSILLPQSVYNEGSRAFVVAFYGVDLYGNKNFGPFGSIDYELFGGTVEIPSDIQFLSEFFEMLKYSSPVVYNNLVASGMDVSSIKVGVKHIEGGMLVWNTPLSGLRLSVTDLLGEMYYKLGPMTNTSDISEFSVMSTEYDFDNFTLSAERVKVIFDDNAGGMSTEIEGYYGALSWDISRWLTIGLAYGEYYPNAKDKDGMEIRKMPEDLPPDYEGPLEDYYAWQKDITASIRFNINEFWCFKLETHFYDGLGLTNIADNPPADSEQYWNLYLVKMSLNF